MKYTITRLDSSFTKRIIDCDGMDLSLDDFILFYNIPNEITRSQKISNIGEIDVIYMINKSQVREVEIEEEDKKL